MGKERVILGRIDSYSPADITPIIEDGIQEFNLAPKGHSQITIKPKGRRASIEFH